MDVVANGISVLSREWKIVLGILYIFFLCSGIAYLCLRMLLRNGYTIAEYLSLSIAGGLIPLFGAIGLIWLLDLFPKVKINLTAVLEIFFVVVASVYLFQSSRNRKPVKRTAYIPILLSLILGISIFLRLAFIVKLIVPLYFDSAEHYLIIQRLATDFQTSTFPTYQSLTGAYYHVGFHVLAAAVSQALNLSIADTMLILGQIILSLVPLPLYFIIKQITKSELPAVAATLLAGWGWYMPAHAVNWGKYPALLSILALEFVLGCVILLFQCVKPHRWVLAVICAISILLATFIHTRALVFIAIVFFSVAAAFGWSKLSQLPRYILFSLLMGALIALAILVQTNPIQNLALDPYRGNGIWMTLVILLLFPFTWTEFPRASFASVSSILLILASLFISAAKFVPYYAAQALLDRAFVEMVLFLPLTVLGGLGVAGLLRTMNEVSFFQEARHSWARWIILLWLLVLFSWNFTKYDFSPSCCLLFTENDQKALNWMDQNTPSNAVVAVASSEAVMFESSPSIWYPGSDGGIWIPPLIHRNVVNLPYWEDFSDPNVFRDLCRREVNYIYIGGTGQSFNSAWLSVIPDWYEKLFNQSTVQVYRIKKCPNQ